MPVTHVEDFAAFDFAVRFKLEVYRLIKESPGASKNLRYREQLEGASSDIEGTMSEGFGRGRPKEFALYLRTASTADISVRPPASRRSRGPSAVESRQEPSGGARNGGVSEILCVRRF